MNNQYVTFHEFGSPQSVLKIEEGTSTTLHGNEVLVKMMLSPINPSDLIPIRGAYRHRTVLPGVPGYEGVGIVVDIGDTVDPSLLNQRVLPLRGAGTWQNYVKAPAEYAVVLPKEIDNYTAATLYINPLTAWVICCETLKITSGQTLVVNACGSFIGRIFAQLSKKLGFTLIAVVRDDTHTEGLKSLGASFVINTSIKNIKPEILEITNGRGADAAIDCVGGKEGTELAFSIRPLGTFMTLGLLSGKQVDWMNIHKNSTVNVKLFHLRHWNHEVSKEKWHDVFKQLTDMVVDKTLNLDFIDRTYPLSRINDAVQYMEHADKRYGKVFLKNTYF